MRSLVTVLAAAVLAGVGVYLLFDWAGALSLLQNQVVINITLFVLLLVCTSTASAALALLLRRSLERTDQTTYRRLEERIQALEGRRSPEKQSAVDSEAGR